MSTFFPLTRRDQMTIQQVDDEIILYDGRTAQANVLNHTAAVIWKLCDGKTSVTDIARRASAQLNAPVNESLVWYTINQLSKKNLLETRMAMPPHVKGMTRRDFIRAGAIGAAVVLPVIVAMSAPKAASAASCVETGGSCVLDPNICCAGPTACVGGICA